MPTLYDSKLIIPSPLMEVNKEYQRSADGKKVGSLFIITLKGTIVPYKGSPNSQSDFPACFWTLAGYPPDEVVPAESRLAAIKTKQDRLRQLFRNDGKLFEVTLWDGSANTFKCNPRLRGPIQFLEGIWFEKCDFVITLEADKVYIHGLDGGTYEDDMGDTDDIIDNFISQVNESWQVEFGDEQQPDTFRVTHSLSATGKRFYDLTGILAREAWENAQAYVTQRLGWDASKAIATGVIPVPVVAFGHCNHVRTQQIGETDGTFAATETWLIASGSSQDGYALESFTVTKKETAQDGLTTVTIDGRIQGLNTNQLDGIAYHGNNKFEQASLRFSKVESQLLTRAQVYAGISLNPIPLAKTVGKNPNVGEISFNWETNNRPTNCITGSASETITVTDDNKNGDVDLFASVVVLGREAGPVLQNLATTPSRKRTVSIEYVMSGVNSGCDFNSLMSNEPNTDAIVAAVKPNNVYQIFKEQDTKSWTPQTSRGTRNVSWVYEV